MIEIDISSKNAKQLLVTELAGKIHDAIVLCIGTEKVVVDSIGPRVGSLLNENLPRPIFVYGLQGANIHAQNIDRAVKIIKQLHPNKTLLVVDAAVGEQSQIGRVQLTNGNISPGAATNKSLSKVGDISIVGIVAHKDMLDFYNNSVEQSILAERISQFIATTIVMASKADIS